MNEMSSIDSDRRLFGTDARIANLALQGGGSHGAFTWGVLDRILEDGRLAINAFSGTSAGAMNAVVCVDGYQRGGLDGAREALDDFWRTVSNKSIGNPAKPTWLDYLTGRWSLEYSPGYHMLDTMTRSFSPYQWNPLNINPLLDLLQETVDFERVRACEDIDLFISATNVETGRVKVFHREELTAEMVMASACLPTFYQAVEIDGVPYWDGGYMGNPVLFPFNTETDCPDIIVVQINPIRREGVPYSAHDIINRINEISFNASLLKEFRSINFVSRLIREGKLNPKYYKDVHIHLIENEAALKPLEASSKLNTGWSFLTHLKELGRQTAEQWLETNLDKVGKVSTVDIEDRFP